MKDIRTRENYTGPVRTIDRAVIYPQRIKRTVLKTREKVDQASGYDQEQNENTYAGDRTVGMAKTGVLMGREAAIKGYKETVKLRQHTRNRKKHIIDEIQDDTALRVGTDVIVIDPDREYARIGDLNKKVTRMVSITDNAYQNGKLSEENHHLSTGKTYRLHKESDKELTKMVSNQAEKGQEILRNQYRVKRAREAYVKRSERSVRKAFASLKRAIADSKIMAGALAVTSCIAIVTIIVCTFFGSAFYILGDEPDPGYIPEDFISVGDGSIVEVAASQIGNVGGEPYWSWYGFNSRVEWCACFVSWCANQCGYIEEGIIPKFAGVGTGIEWFQDRHQWQKRGHHPQPGDIIFFDWEGNGYGSHVGIVESSDDLYVYTIEGNTSDRCKRRTYFLNSSVIMGYGILCY